MSEWVVPNISSGYEDAEVLACQQGSTIKELEWMERIIVCAKLFTCYTKSTQPIWTGQTAYALLPSRVPLKILQENKLRHLHFLFNIGTPRTRPGTPRSSSSHQLRTNLLHSSPHCCKANRREILNFAGGFYRFPTDAAAFQNFNQISVPKESTHQGLSIAPRIMIFLRQIKSTISLMTSVIEAQALSAARPSSGDISVTILKAGFSWRMDADQEMERNVIGGPEALVERFDNRVQGRSAKQLPPPPQC
ncbi:unnamed protein product [Nesidiocoris tenuis]|uniref:Uncharacterized protein n=1 Tax=Nesidiocoris tenuis TaxID=355587 RepID=A0A6H5GP67_9HEMI|nr:unnamed protein product [Nesidiocoris tenuis]